MGPKSPCPSCPYRKDAQLGYWDIDDYLSVLYSEADINNARSFACHQHVDLPSNEMGACAGWLLDQKNRGIPNIALRVRIQLREDKDVIAQIEEVHDGGNEMFSSAAEMCMSNIEECIRIYELRIKNAKTILPDTSRDSKVDH